MPLFYRDTILAGEKNCDVEVIARAVMDWLREAHPTAVPFEPYEERCMTNELEAVIFKTVKSACTSPPPR